jgi:membrane associated rhomboid family serine protease
VLPALIGLVVVGYLTYRALTAEERLRILRATVQQIKPLVLFGRQEIAPLRQALRARTPLALLTPAIVVVHVVVFAGLLLGAGSRSDTATLLSWGASFGPSTSNGEWWRLVTSLFVQPSFFALLIDCAAIVQVGLVVERLFGPLPYATTYLASGTMAGLVGLSLSPMQVSVGGTAGIFGLYGLLIAAVVFCRQQDAPVTVRVKALKRLAPVTVAFVVGSFIADGAGGNAGSLVGLLTGLIFGLVVARDAGQRAPAWRPAVAAFGATCAIVTVGAVLLHGMVDVRPELRRLIEVEHRTAARYEAASAQFRQGKLTVKQLAELIERSIIPELGAENARISRLHGVPREDAPLVADARAYLRLRTQSWRLRAKGLREEGAPLDPRSAGPMSEAAFRTKAEAQHRSTARTLGEAEGAERASLETLKRLPQ